jgi:tRNA1(Val) A37 N6-methylase TrmN6
METSAGTLLNGRLRHAQPSRGHRTALEPVLLAAAVPARPGERVLEAGTGSGAALLCLAARVPGLSGVGIERDPAMAALARDNIAANGLTGIDIIAGDIAGLLPPGPCDHAFANPPWHGPGTPSPDPNREAAKRGGADLLATWCRALAGPLRHHGTLTLIIPASLLPAGLAALAAAGCGSPAVLPLWPRPGRPARLALVQGVRGGRGPCRLLAGLTLHVEAGGFTAAADAILRQGAGLDLRDRQPRRT